MTKPAGTPRKKPEPRRRKTSLVAQSAQGHGQLTSLTLSPPTLRYHDSTARIAEVAPDPSRSFYLGSTSYAAVFTEDRASLPDAVHEQPSERLSVAPSTSIQMVGSRHCQFSIGASVVSALVPFQFFENSVKMYFDVQKASALIGPLITSLLPQLRQDLEKVNPAGVDAHMLYAEMTKNSARPFKVPSTMLPSEFHTMLTGKNLRWETLGLILVVAASNAQFTSPHDPIFMLPGGRKLDKDRFIEDVIHATNDCITICQAHGAVNDSKYRDVADSACITEYDLLNFESSHGVACVYAHFGHQQLLWRQLSVKPLPISRPEQAHFW